MTIDAKPTPHLFTLPQRVYAVSCRTHHPDTERVVILLDKPQNGQCFSIAVRYKEGKYHDTNTGWGIVMDLSNTVWMESPYWEGPYYVGNVTANIIMNDLECDTVFHDPKAAALHVNELNMGSFGNPTYTVVTEFGVGVDEQGLLTQYIMTAK